MNQDLAHAALSLVGTPFRLHGTRPESGLDCVGLVAEVLRRGGRVVCPPQGYTLRSASVTRWLKHAERSGLERAADDGDVVLCMVNPVQPHLLIRVSGGYVHAHAGLGRVTFLPAPLPWPIAVQWRLTKKDN